MIRRFSVGAAAVAVCAIAHAGPAMAQDQGTPWLGWYVGAAIGMNWSDNALNTSAMVPPHPANPIVISPADAALIRSSGGSSKTGFVGGIEGGYNWRYNNWLLGVETDYGGLDSSQSATNTATSTGPVINPPGVPVSYTLTQHATTSWMWTLRPRLGYVYGPWLFYGTGGVATSGVKLNVTFSDNRSTTDSLNTSDSATRTGWIAGGGAGYAITQNISVKGEWLYADLGSVNTTLVAPSGYVQLNSKADFRNSILRFGIDYRF
jgi:outer membrane immunogenic protein